MGGERRQAGQPAPQRRRPAERESLRNLLFRTAFLVWSLDGQRYSFDAGARKA